MNRILICVFIIICPFCFVNSQEALSFSQYNNNKLFINPAYAGVRNAISYNLAVRKLWLQTKKSPTSYGFGVSSPINKTMFSLGSVIRYNNIGPMNYYDIKGIYAYLVRVNPQTLLSLGVSAGIGGYNLNTMDLRKIKKDDPQFAYDIKNQITPNFGLGIYLYKERGYLSISCANIWPNKFDHGVQSDGANFSAPDIYCGTSYAFPVMENVHVKPTIFYKLSIGGFSSLDIGLDFVYNDLIMIGVSNRLNEHWCFMFHYQPVKNIGFCYSYEIPMFSYLGNPGGHEISIVFDIDKYYRKTRKRRFYKKRDKSVKNLRSIRYF